MLYYHRIDISDRIDINKTSASKEWCDICVYCFFVDKRWKFHTYVCNRCHDVLMMSVNLNDSAILNICSVDYFGITNELAKVMLKIYSEILT